MVSAINAMRCGGQPWTTQKWLWFAVLQMLFFGISEYNWRALSKFRKVMGNTAFKRHLIFSVPFVFNAPSILCCSWQSSEIGMGKEIYKRRGFYFLSMSCPFSLPNCLCLWGSLHNRLHGPKHLHLLPEFPSGTCPKMLLSRKLVFSTTQAQGQVLLHQQPNYLLTVWSSITHPTAISSSAREWIIQSWETKRKKTYRFRSSVRTILRVNSIK